MIWKQPILSIMEADGCMWHSCAIKPSKKTLKAYWCGTLTSDPPYTHSHKRLADGCGLYSQMNDQQKDFLNIITNYNIEARYPEDKDALSRMLTKEACRELIDETKQLLQWIKEKL